MSFIKQAKQTISEFADQCDAAGIDNDLEAEQLTIHLVDRRVYLLNYHGVAKELWLSSPISGAHHFHWQDESWICTRSQQPLKVILERELNSLGYSINL